MEGNYSGEIVRGVAHGLGEFEYDGIRVLGQFQHGQLHGHGLVLLGIGEFEWGFTFREGVSNGFGK